MATTLAIENEVEISLPTPALKGILEIPEGARALVLFAHGSGSSRFSTRNQFVAQLLRDHGLATLLLDLLTPEESEDRSYVFDISLLAERLMQVCHWLASQERTRELALGLFGSSTGAGAALMAAAQLKSEVFAVVSRGGRPDLAAAFLTLVEAPTLLIVGGLDEVVLELNEEAKRKMTTEVELEIIPGATHLFEEPGALTKVAQLAAEWFVRHQPDRAKASTKRGAHGSTDKFVDPR